MRTVARTVRAEQWLEVTNVSHLVGGTDLVGTDLAATDLLGIDFAATDFAGANLACSYKIEIVPFPLTIVWSKM